MISRLIKAQIIAYFLVNGVINAQNDHAHYAFTNPNFQNYTMGNGLPSNFCYKTIQDKYGYMWFATFNGLARFDGYHFKYFQQQSKNKSHQIPSNWVIDITSDSIGNIWINTDAGICKYDYATDKIISYLSKIRGWGKINYTAPNKIYVSSYAGIDEYAIKSDSLHFYKNYPESSGNTISNLVSINNLLIATPEDHPSLITIRDSKINYIKELQLKNTKELIVINSVTPLNKNELLLNTRKFGILHLNLINYSCKRVYEDKLNTSIDISCSITYTLGKETYLIVGTNGEGVYAINTKNNQTYQFNYTNTSPIALLSNIITGLTKDNNNGIWISTINGVSYFHPSLQKNKPFYFHNNSSIPENVVINCVQKIDDKNVLIGTESSGIFNYNIKDKTTEKVNHASINNIEISSIESLKNGIYLIATSKGVFQYNANNKTVSPFKTKGKPFEEFTLRVKRLNDSLVGFCTKKGVYLYNLAKEEINFIESSISGSSESNRITKDIHLDHENNLWVVRFFNGYLCYDFKTKTTTDCTPISLKNKPINYLNIISSANSKTLFISTSAGIIVQNQSRKTSSSILNSSNGLEGDIIENVALDYFSNSIYYTSPVGLYKYNLNTKQNTIINSFENYKPKWFNSLSWSYDSLLMLSVSNYFIFSNPTLRFTNNKPPSNHIESILVNGNPILLPKDNELVLSNSENNLVFEISANVYPQSDKNQLYYSLNDEEWNLSKTGTINLYNLKPGNYYLDYYIINNESVYSSKIIKFKFRIKELFYNTIAFRITLIFFIGLILWLIYYYKKKSNQKLILAKEQISRDLHDELGANVSSINIMAKLISNKIEEHDALKPYIQSIANYSMQVSDTINDIIWNINPKFNTLEELINKITKYASETLEGANINYRLKVDNHLKNLELPNKTKYYIYLIAKEALNNCAKYSQAKEVQINLSTTSNWFTLEISDKGIGFKESAYDIGNGLINMKKRAAEIKATFEITTQIDKGTKIFLKLKIA